MSDSIEQKNVKDMSAAEIADFERTHGIRHRPGRREAADVPGGQKLYADMTPHEREAFRREHGIRQ